MDVRLMNSSDATRLLAEMKGERERRPAEGAVDIGVALFVTSDPACVNSPPGFPLQPLDGSQTL